MEVFTFDRAEHEVTRHGSIGLHATRIAQFAETARATCLAGAPGEIHTTGSDTGLTAIALEGGQVTVFEPETS